MLKHKINRCKKEQIQASTDTVCPKFHYRLYMPQKFPPCIILLLHKIYAHCFMAFDVIIKKCGNTNQAFAFLSDDYIISDMIFIAPSNRILIQSTVFKTVPRFPKIVSIDQHFEFRIKINVIRIFRLLNLQTVLL